jgi:hypothetical protein
MAGVQFFKPVGTGGGTGYSIWPDLSVYGVLAVWKDESCARAFLASPLFGKFISRSSEQFTLLMWPRSSKGSWSGFSAWECRAAESRTGLVCALTRATLKRSYLRAFWAQVPAVSRVHDQAEGVLFSKGIGEVPILEQATFSVWEGRAAMEAFAYHGPHALSIGRTRRADGFKEEMFTRLEPFGAVGTWNGVNPLAAYLPPYPAPGPGESNP